ncbi:hypothetical protein BH09VER1_BH09VER1_45810 [soil metagenome]
MLGVLILLLGALPFALGLCAFRSETQYELRGQTEVRHGDLIVSWSLVRCPATGQSSFVPGCLTADEKANGLQVQWTWKGDSKRKLEVDGITGTIAQGDRNEPLDAPYKHWSGASSSQKNVYYAFVSTGGYAKDWPMGLCQMRLHYMANGAPYDDELTVEQVAKRRFGFFAPFSSYYFW